MGKQIVTMEEFAKKHGKHDLERLGIFIEMPYIRAKANQGKAKAGTPEILRSMLPSGPKTKCGNMDGYFDNEFKRVFKGERPKKNNKGTGAASTKVTFIPTGPSKRHGCPGDYFGTFGGHISAFSPKKRPTAKSASEPPNPVTSPGKKGGPGYIDITIGKYPAHTTERPKQPKKKEEKGVQRNAPMISMHFPQPYFEKNPYRDPLKDPPTKRLYIRPKEQKLDPKLQGRPLFAPTGPAKWLGGCKAGCFSKWPEWMQDRWMTPAQRAKFVKPVKGKKPPPPRVNQTEFTPQSMATKTMFTTSMLYKTDFSMNSTNWKTYEPTYVKHLLKSVV